MVALGLGFAQAAVAIVFPGPRTLHADLTLKETITSCEVAVGIGAMFALLLLLPLGASLWAGRRSARDRTGYGVVRDYAIMLAVTSLLFSAVVIPYLPYHHTIPDSLAVFSAGATPGLLAALLLLWTWRNGSDLSVR
jgi:hypothetical protein